MISESFASSGYNCLGLTNEPSFLRKEEIGDIFEPFSENGLKGANLNMLRLCFPFSGAI